MADTGLQVCSTVDSESWSGTFDTASLNTSDTTRCLNIGNTYVPAVISGFDFSAVPAGATIDGIEVQAEFSSGGAGVTAYIQLSASWDGGSSYTATKEDSVLGATDTVRTYGGAADTWGRTWSQTELGANFKLKVEGKASGPTSACRLDYLVAKVYYTAASGGTGISQVIMF